MEGHLMRLENRFDTLGIEIVQKTHLPDALI